MTCSTHIEAGVKALVEGDRNGQLHFAGRDVVPDRQALVLLLHPVRVEVGARERVRAARAQHRRRRQYEPPRTAHPGNVRSSEITIPQLGSNV